MTDLQSQISAIDKRFSSHEVGCELRQRSTLEALDRLTKRVQWLMCAVIALAALDIAKSPLAELVRILMPLVAP